MPRIGTANSAANSMAATSPQSDAWSHTRVSYLIAWFLLLYCALNSWQWRPIALFKEAQPAFPVTVSDTDLYFKPMAGAC